MGKGHSFTSPLRYPGGKGALANFIKRVMVENSLLDCDYAELYGGGASIAWSLLFEEYVRYVYVNDLDPAIYAFWHAVLYQTDALCRRIEAIPVTIDEWCRQRQVQEFPEEHSPLDLGFSTFYLNRTNRSGILTAGVIGGVNQAGEWKLDARFNKTDLISRIQRIGRYRSRIHLSARDAAEFMQVELRELPRRMLVYLDPPYYEKGQDLYRNHYTRADHAGISREVRRIRQPWIVSYDAAPEISNLYRGCQQLDYRIEYSAQERYAGAEFIFASRGLVLPQVDCPMNLPQPIWTPT